MPRELAPIEDFLQLLARAVRQFHTYPAASPMCGDAVNACHHALTALDGRDHLTFRVAPDALVVDDARITVAIVAQELARRLHAAHVVSVEIDATAVPRHLSRFCAHLASGDTLHKNKTTLAELLTEDGVDSIVAVMAHRPEVLEVGVPDAPICDLVEREQQRRRDWLGTGGPVTYLYPPDKGWVRLDPGSGLDQVSLIDLAVLVNDPAEVATMLLRLTDDDPIGPEERKTALERKFSDVATLFSSLDPRLARVMFGKLARAVLGLEPSRRQDLLRRTILPGLLDGRADGTVLQDFPDVDLVDSLFLLLELETAAPEVLAAALHRLDLPEARRGAIAPLLDARLRGDKGESSDQSRSHDIDRLAHGLIRVDAAPGKDFSEFSAFDLSIDDQTTVAFASMHTAIGATNQRTARLNLLAHLLRFQPDPAVAETFLRQAAALFGDLHRSGRWQELSTWAARFRQVASNLRSSRPDVATTISDALIAFAVPARVVAYAELHDSADDRPSAKALVEAFDITLVPGMLAALDDPAWQSKSALIVSMMCDYARRFAPALAVQLDSVKTSAARAIVKALGFAGSGYEAAIDRQLEHTDDQTSREALRALARIGSTQAAAFVAAHVQDGPAEQRAAAEEALWRLPADSARALVRQLLGSRHFVVEHPDLASRLLTRAANTGAGRDGLQEVLAEIEPLRFRFWNPRLVRVALKARELRTK